MWQIRATWFKEDKDSTFMKQMLDLKPLDYIKTVATLLDTEIVKTDVNITGGILERVITIRHSERASTFYDCLLPMYDNGSLLCLTLMDSPNLSMVCVSEWINDDDVDELDFCPFNVQLTVLVGVLATALVMYA